MWFNVQCPDLGKARAEAENNFERAFVSGMCDAARGRFQIKQPLTHRSPKGRDWVGSGHFRPACTEGSPERTRREVGI